MLEQIAGDPSRFQGRRWIQCFARRPPKHAALFDLGVNTKLPPGRSSASLNAPYFATTFFGAENSEVPPAPSVETVAEPRRILPSSVPAGSAPRNYSAMR